jgi:hypothetical protein
MSAAQYAKFAFVYDYAASRSGIEAGWEYIC